MVKQANQSELEGGADQAQDLSSAEVSLPAEKISSAHQVLDKMRLIVDPHRGPEATESLDQLSAPSRVMDVHAGLKNNDVFVVEACINNQNPLQVNLALDGMLHAQEINTIEVNGSVSDRALSLIEQRLAAAGLPAYASSIMVDIWASDLAMAPPLSEEMEQKLSDTAGIAHNYIAARLQERNLKPEISPNQKLRAGELVNSRKGEPSFSSAA